MAGIFGLRGAGGGERSVRYGFPSNIKFAELLAFIGQTGILTLSLQNYWENQSKLYYIMINNIVENFPVIA